MLESVKLSMGLSAGRPGVADDPATSSSTVATPLSALIDMQHEQLLERDDKAGVRDDCEFALIRKLPSSTQQFSKARTQPGLC